MIDPLSLPWGSKKKPPGEQKPNFLGVRNEVAREALAAEARIKIQVTGVPGQPNAVYEVKYEPGCRLKHYLSQLKLVHTAIYSAMRDASNPEVGRVRLTYIPNEKSHITLGHPAVSSVMEFQRSRVDAMEVAANMGREGRGPAPKIVERKK